jgi:secondary thiamine-phosphate synthase enzyme
MRQDTRQITVETTGRGLYEITRPAQGLVRDFAVLSGLCTFWVQHTSASLLVQENADPEVRADLERFFERLVPDGDRIFRHTTEGEDDMPAHVRTALTTVHLGIPIVNGRLALGTWQGIYLWEHRCHPHQRQVVVHLLGA